MSRHVVVVGGGVVGLATAYYLRRGGADVTVLERSAVGAGASWGNSGWIAPTFVAPLAAPGMVGTAMRALARPNGSFYLSLRHLPRLAPWLWRFWRASSAARYEAGMRATALLARPAARLYEDLVADGIECELRVGELVHAFQSRETAEKVRRTFAPLAEFDVEIPDTVLDGPELREIEPALGPAVAAGFVVPNERTVYPAALLQGLQRRLVELGATVREHQPVSGFETRGRRIAAVRTGDELVAADEVVLAAGVWTRELARWLGVRLPLEAGKGYSFTVSPEVMPSHSLHLYEAKVAVSPFRNGLRLAGTMELSGTGHRLDRRRVAAVARASSPYMRGWPDTSVREEWMGMRPMTPDGLPVLGRPSRWQNVCVATGHGMAGVLLGPATGQALAARVLDDLDPEVLQPFSPDRFSRRAASRRTEPSMQ